MRRGEPSSGHTELEQVTSGKGALFSARNVERCVPMCWALIMRTTVGSINRTNQSLHSLTVARLGRLPQETFGRSHVPRNSSLVSSKEPRNLICTNFTKKEKSQHVFGSHHYEC